MKACKCVLPRAQEVADGNHARLEPAGDKSEAYLDALESMVDPVLVRKLQHLDAMATEFYEGIDALRRAYCALHRGVDPHDVTLAQLHASCHEFSGSSARLRSELAALLAHADAMVPSIETASPEFYRVCIDKDADFVPRSWMDQKFPTVHRLLIEALDMCRPASAVLPDSCDPNSP